MSRNVVACIVLAAIAFSFTSSAAVPAAAAPLVSTSSHSVYLPLVAGTIQLPVDGETTAFPPVGAPDPAVRWMVDQVQQDTVRDYVGDLTGERPVIVGGQTYRISTRYVYSQGPISVTTRYAGNHLAGLGLDVEYHQWGPETAPNVVGQSTGLTRPSDVFMVTAHLDDMPTGLQAPGADDNASGSSAVLVAADVLAQFSWDCTLRFALFTGEEKGLLGSEAYALRAKNRGENIAGVFNLDMIGWNTPGSPRGIDLHARSSLPATVDLANQAASVVEAYGLGLIAEVRGDGSGSSDHASFWKYGYPAILGIEDFYPNNQDFDPYYHKTSDTLSTLDLGYLTAYVKLAVAETAHMARCLTTGILQGQIVANHDRSPIPNAQISVTDAAGREYLWRAGADGRYSQAVPPGVYSVTASAYGYENGTARGVAIPNHGSGSNDFELAAATPASPAVSIALDAGKTKLTWPHLSPDIAYEVHASDAPYFTPSAGTRITTVSAAHVPGSNETLTYAEPGSGSGDTQGYRFYIVIGLNAAGTGAASPRTGEFRLDLVPP